MERRGDKTNGSDKLSSRPMYKYEDDPPDGGWGWLVVGACHICLFLSHGSLTGFAPFIVRLNQYFADDGAGAVGGISGIAYFVTLAISPLSSGLINRYGCRRIVFIGGVISSCGLFTTSFATNVYYLYITYGVITGIGYGLIVTPVMSFTARYFTTKYARANGIVFAGLATAWIALPQLCQFLIDRYGWRGAMLILSAITSHISACSLIFIPPPQKQVPISDVIEYKPLRRDEEDKNKSGKEGVDAESTTVEKYEKQALDNDLQTENNEQDTSKHACFDREENTAKRIRRNWKDTEFCMRFLKIFDITLFSDPSFVVMCFIFISTSIGAFPTFLYLAARAVSYGIPQPLPTMLITIWGAASLVGRLTHGVIIDSKILTAEQGLAVSLSICGLVNIFSIFTTNFTGLAIMYGMFGLFNGVYHPLATVVLKELIGAKKLPQSQGFCQLFRGIGGLIGPPVTGLIYDASKSFNVCYIYSGCVLIFCAIVQSISLPCIRRYRRKKQVYSNTGHAEVISLDIDM